MDTTNHNSDNPDKEPEDRLANAGAAECSHRDLIISRVVDGRAGARERRLTVQHRILNLDLLYPQFTSHC